MQTTAAVPDSLTELFTTVRAATLGMVAHLSAEDCNLQAMPETSPAKWHLAHTTWFFETFVLDAFCPDYLPVNPVYAVLFNSYYNGIGEQYPRPQRGLLSRPTLEEVLQYRAAVDAAVMELLTHEGHPAGRDIRERIELGLHHEAQHQELLLTDIKYSLFQNPLLPAYREAVAPAVRRAASALPGDESGRQAGTLEFVQFPGGRAETGFAGAGFCFDNELPRHVAWLRPFAFARRLVTNAEYLEFIDDGGYENPVHWLADGWTEVQRAGWRHPLYWGRVDGQWLEYTLNGLQPLDGAAPVTHVSYFEAQAYAAWAGKRLPTEAEWEHVAAAQPATATANFLDAGLLHPTAAGATGIAQLHGDCWEWTGSAYLPYPGYAPLPGAVGEYNGKFMSGQMVLRGGSCMSRAFHIRPSYRNFFYPRDRWQCTGIRLAEDA